MTTFPGGGAAAAVERAQIDEATGALEALVAASDDGGDLLVLIQQMCQHALRVVPGADMASVALRQPDGTFHTATWPCTPEAVLSRKVVEGSVQGCAR